MSEGPMRLQKFLSRAGVASRRAAERLIDEGRVRVAGRPVTEQGTRVRPEEIVEVDGRRVRLSPLRWIALHKPPGVISSRHDPGGRRTVYDLLPEGPLRELFHVGRLDYMSEGLLLLTNAGDLASRLMHPSSEVAKRYEIVVAAPAPPRLVERLREGVVLEDGRAAADAATLAPGPSAAERTLLLTLHEGRNREIRRLLEALGVEIHRLRRVAVGPVELGPLPPEAWRDLTEEEVEALRGAAERSPEKSSRHEESREGD